MINTTDSHPSSSLQIPDLARQLQKDIKEINAEVGLFATYSLPGACCPWTSREESRRGLLSSFLP